MTQIAEGVRNAQSAYAENGGKVNPNDYEHVNGDIPYGKSMAMRSKADLLCTVHFEVSLSADTSTNASGGVGVLFGAISLGGKSGEENKETALTKVKFDVPVKLPTR